MSAPGWQFDPVRLAIYAILAALAATFIWWLVDRGLRALAGFHVPLGAVRDGGIVLPRGDTPTGSGKCELPRSRVLLVAPQQAVRQRLAEYPAVMLVDLAEVFLRAEGDELGKPSSIDAFFDQLLGKANAGPPAAARPPLLVASGLELILRDAVRRRAALMFCERADRALDRKELRGIAMITEMSPLERILDAFDTDEEGDPLARSVREELRWSRFFQHFSTVTFQPIDKLQEIDIVGRLNTECPDLDQGRIRAKLILAKELRWLPGSVVDATIDMSDPISELLRPTDADGNRTRFPVSSADMVGKYAEPIIRWVASQDVPSPEAAIDFMRSALIEYYEQCWAASTQAERLVLNAIAEGHFVNMHNTVALQSLVRRGLVVLDPSPRLMNRSFGLFIKQSERPDRLDEWRRKMPQSRWKLSRWAILLAAPAAVFILIMAAAETGDDLTALFSLLAAAAPALINLMFRSVRT